MEGAAPQLVLASRSRQQGSNFSCVQLPFLGVIIFPRPSLSYLEAGVSERTLRERFSYRIYTQHLHRSHFQDMFYLISLFEHVY